MKNLQKLFSMAMLVCMAVTLFSCSKDEEELSVETGIVGVWEVASTEILVDGKTTEAFVQEVIKETGLSEDEVMNLFNFNQEPDEDESGYKIEFRSDNTFLTEVDKEDGGKEGEYEERGSWSSGANKSVTISYPEGYDVEFTVKSMKSNAAILSLIDNRTEEIQGNEYKIEIEQLVYLKK